MDFKTDFSLDVFIIQMKVGFLLFVWAVTYVIGCSMTVTSHADIMYCSSGVYIFFATLLTCGTIHRLEIVGYSMFFIGVYLMFTDPFATKAGMESQSYLGDFYAFIGAGASALCIYYSKKNVKLMPIVSLTQIFIVFVFFTYAIFPFLTSSPNFFSFDPEYGAFGFLVDWNAFVDVMCINAPITGILGNLGFYGSFFYFPIEIVSGVMLLEPFCAQTAGILLGQDEIPGIKTLLGLIVISAGFLFAGFGAMYKTQTKIEIVSYNNDIELAD